MALPANVDTGLVTGRFIVGVIDGPDEDSEPDAIPAQGAITFTASVPYLPNPSAGTTILKAPIVAVLDGEGWLCVRLPDGTAGAQGVRLVATDDPDLSVQGWTWTVTYGFKNVNNVPVRIASHSMALPSGATIDLTSVVKVPSSAGIGIEQAEALAATAQTAAQEAAASASLAAEAANATDTGVATLVTQGGNTTTALDRAYRERVSVLEYGAIGDGATNDTAAFNAAMATGHPVAVPPGTYLVSGASTSLPLDLHIQQGATIKHTGSGAALTITGSTSTPVPVTADVLPGASQILATGHTVTPGQWIRLRSTRLYDSHSTLIPIAELVQVHAVDGNTITPRIPIQGGPYLPSDNATITPLSMVEGVHIHGRGTIEGNYLAAQSQTGIRIAFATDVTVTGIRTVGFDWRHIAPEDCANVRIDGVNLEWGHTTGTGYGIAPTGAIQDVVIDGCYFTDIRHAFTTSNSPADGGVGRRMVVQNSHIFYSRPHEGGQQGDALDTHTAAEDISFISNTITGSSGLGINHECRSGRIVGNLIIDTASHGIHAHNESDLPGSVEIRDNRVVRPGGDGVRVSPPTRGGTEPTTGVIITGNAVDAALGDAYRIGIAGFPTVNGLTLMGNQATGTTGAFIRILNTAVMVELANLAVTGNKTVIKP